MSAQPVPDLAQHAAYRGLWSTVAVVVGAVGAAAAIARLGPLVVGLQLATVIPVVGILGYALALDMHLRMRAIAEISVLSGLVVVIFAGYVELVGVWALVVVPLVVVSTPRLVSRALARSPWGRRVVDADVPTVAALVSRKAWEHWDPDDVRQPPRVPDDMHEASLNALCRYWVDSARALQERLGPRRALEIVAMREACLDEMRRRDDRGFAQWLAAGADTADPAAFLAPGRNPSWPDPA